MGQVGHSRAQVVGHIGAATGDIGHGIGKVADLLLESRIIGILDAADAPLRLGDAVLHGLRLRPRIGGSRLERRGCIGEVFGEQLLLVGDVAHGIGDDIDLLHQLGLELLRQVGPLDITLDSEDVVLHVTHVGSPLGHVCGCIAQLGDSQRHVRVGGTKGLVDGLRGGVVIARAILKGLVDSRNRGIQRIMHAAQARFRVAHKGLGILVRRTGARQQVARRIEQAGGGLQQSRELVHASRGVAQGRDGTGQRARQVAGVGRDLIAIHKL